jgi:hypothetical protein
MGERSHPQSLGGMGARSHPRGYCGAAPFNSPIAPKLNWTTCTLNIKKHCDLTPILLNYWTHIAITSTALVVNNTNLKQIYNSEIVQKLVDTLVGVPYKLTLLKKQKQHYIIGVILLSHPQLYHTLTSAYPSSHEYNSAQTTQSQKQYQRFLLLHTTTSSTQLNYSAYVPPLDTEIIWTIGKYDIELTKILHFINLRLPTITIIAE